MKITKIPKAFVVFVIFVSLVPRRTVVRMFDYD